MTKVTELSRSPRASRVHGSSYVAEHGSTYVALWAQQGWALTLPWPSYVRLLILVFGTSQTIIPLCIPNVLVRHFVQVLC